MKKNSKAVLGIVVIVIIILAIWLGKSSNKQVEWKGPTGEGGVTASTSAPVVVSETTKVSDKVTEYHNAELGFAVKYPSTWEKLDAESGASFIVPIDTTQVSTVSKIQVDIAVTPGKCAFPAVTTVKDRGTVKLGSFTFNSIAMNNNVQNRSYSNRMYSLQKDSVCYMFSFAAIAASPASKHLTGSNLTQATNNNKAIINSADTAFTSMVKTFTFVAGPQGQDETKVAPVK